jgi:hypothetical protein
MLYPLRWFRWCLLTTGVVCVVGWPSATVLAIEPRGPLTEEAARQAILKLGEYKKAPISFTLPNPPNAERRGCWYCDLKNKRFWIDVYQEGRSSCFAGGKFEPAPGGGWKARITFRKSLQPSLGPLGPNPNPP